MIAPITTCYALILPFFITRTLLIIGNWGEHAFIDPLDHKNLYKSSTNILGKYNQMSFNVGYHIGHHLNPTMHYSELPSEFNNNINTYGKEDAMVFTDLHYPHIWYFLMTKKYRKLASYFVQLPEAPERSVDEIIALMKNRTQPIHKTLKTA